MPGNAHNHDYLILLVALAVVGWLFYPHLPISVQTVKNDLLQGRESEEINQLATIHQGFAEQVIEVRHSFQDGWHTYTGTAFADRSCEIIKAHTTITHDAATYAVVRFIPELDETSSACVEEPTPRPFTARFRAEPGIAVRALFDNKPIKLDVVEVPKGVDVQPLPQ